jgi:hypothetical protein
MKKELILLFLILLLITSCNKDEKVEEITIESCQECISQGLLWCSNADIQNRCGISPEFQNVCQNNNGNIIFTNDKCEIIQENITKKKLKNINLTYPISSKYSFDYVATRPIKKSSRLYQIIKINKDLYYNYVNKSYNLNSTFIYKNEADSKYTKNVSEIEVREFSDRIELHMYSPILEIGKYDVYSQLFIEGTTWTINSTSRKIWIQQQQYYEEIGVYIRPSFNIGDISLSSTFSKFTLGIIMQNGILNSLDYCYRNETNALILGKGEEELLFIRSSFTLIPDDVNENSSKLNSVSGTIFLQGSYNNSNFIKLKKIEPHNNTIDLKILNTGTNYYDLEYKYNKSTTITFENYTFNIKINDKYNTTEFSSLNDDSYIITTKNNLYLKFNFPGNETYLGGNRTCNLSIWDNQLINYTISPDYDSTGIYYTIYNHTEIITKTNTTNSTV